MALRLVDAFLNPQSTTGLTQAKVYRDSEWNEYRVRFYGPNGVYKGEDGDYHTGDKADALGTAKLSIGLAPPWPRALVMSPKELKAFVRDNKKYLSGDDSLDSIGQTRITVGMMMDRKAEDTAAK